MPVLTTNPECDDCPELDETRHISLCETLDRVLNTGVVLAGEVVISVADIDLIYLNLQLMLTSIETASRAKSLSPRRAEAGAGGSA